MSYFLTFSIFFAVFALSSFITFFFFLCLDQKNINISNKYFYLSFLIIFILSIILSIYIKNDYIDQYQKYEAQYISIQLTNNALNETINKLKEENNYLKNEINNTNRKLLIINNPF